MLACFKFRILSTLFILLLTKCCVAFLAIIGTTYFTTSVPPLSTTGKASPKRSNKNLPISQKLFQAFKLVHQLILIYVEN